MEHLEFSFIPFGRDIIMNSLDKLSDASDSGNLLPYFPGIDKIITNEIINAVHQNDKVQRDIKRSNVLVNHHYYSSLKASRLNAVFSKQPTECS